MRDPAAQDRPANAAAIGATGMSQNGSNRQRAYQWEDPAASAAAARELEEGPGDGRPRLLCEGTVNRLGSRTALAEAPLTDEGGKLYAHATSSCLIFRPGA